MPRIIFQVCDWTGGRSGYILDRRGGGSGVILETVGGRGPHLKAILLSV